MFNSNNPCAITFQRKLRSGDRGFGYVVSVNEVGVLVTEDDRQAVEEALTLVRRTLDAAGVHHTGAREIS